jgi:hypothetical protein
LEGPRETMQKTTNETSARKSQPTIPDSVERQILSAVAGVRYGSVTIAIQDGRVVQIDATEKTRVGAEAYSPH